MTGQVVKARLRDNILMDMAQYIGQEMLQILESIINKEFVKVNMEEITTLPAEVHNSVDEQNKYIIDLFLYKKRKLKNGTKTCYLNAIKHLLMVIDKPLTLIDDTDITYYLDYYERKNMSTTGKRNQDTTVNNERRFLSAFFTWMRKNELRIDNPVEKTEAKHVVRKPIDYFSKEEMAKLRDACDNPRDRALVEMLRSTGARVGEVIPITIDMVDWQTGDIMICGEKGDRFRPIYLDADARYYLKKYLDTRTDTNPSLFVHKRGKHNTLQACGIRTILHQLAISAGIYTRVYPHKMRKTLGMDLKNKGIDIGTIQEILGHADPTVTAAYYAQSTPGTLRGVRERAAA